MPILFHERKIAYFDTPKVASSSIKDALHRLEHGTVLESRFNASKATHQAYPTKKLSGPEDFTRHPDYFKFAVVRDPLKRLLSAYSNRIVHHRDQYRGRMARQRAMLLGLSMEPDIDSFFLRLSRYRLQSGSIRHHTNLVEHYIGKDLARFDAIYPIEKLDQLAADLGARTGEPVVFGRLQTGGPKVTPDMLSPAAFRALMDYLRPEYALLKEYYTPPDPAEPSGTAQSPARMQSRPMAADPDRGYSAAATTGVTPGPNFFGTTNSSWYDRSTFTSQTSWFSPRMFRAANIADSIEWS